MNKIKLAKLLVQHNDIKALFESQEFDASTLNKVIAQEIMEVLPDTVNQESTGCYRVDPDNLTWYLINAVQELSAKVDALEAQLSGE